MVPCPAHPNQRRLVPGRGIILVLVSGAPYDRLAKLLWSRVRPPLWKKMKMVPGVGTMEFRAPCPREGTGPFSVDSG